MPGTRIVAKTEVSLSRSLRLIEHGPVVLITTEARGVPNIAACSWLMPAAPDPPTLALSLGAGSQTRRNLEDRGEFALNVPPRSLARETHFCGKVSGREVRKERETGLRLEPAGKVRAPLVTACVGHLECVVRDARPVGHQVLYLAEVVLALAEGDLFDETWNTDDERARTLHHLGGDLYTSPGRRVPIDLQRVPAW